MMNDRQTQVTEAERDQLVENIEKKLKKLNDFVSNIKKLRKTKKEDNNQFVLQTLIDKLKLLEQKSELLKNVPGTFRESMEIEIENTKSEIAELEFIKNLKARQKEHHLPESDIGEFSKISQEIRESKTPDEKSAALFKKTKLLAGWRTSLREWYGEQDPSYKLITDEMTKTSSESLRINSELADKIIPPPLAQQNNPTVEEENKGLETLNNLDLPPPVNDEILEETQAKKQDENPPPYPHELEEKEKKEEGKKEQKTFTPSSELPPKKGLRARFHDYRLRKNIGKNFDELYVETITALREQTIEAKQSFGKYQQITQGDNLNNLTKTAEKLQNTLETYKSLLIEKIHRGSLSPKKNNALWEQVKKIEEQIEHIAEIKTNIENLGTGFQPTKISTYGNYQSGPDVDNKKNLEEFKQNTTPGVAKVGNASDLTRPAEPTNDYWIENTIDINQNVQIHTGIVPVATDTSFRHELHFDAEIIKALEDKDNFPRHKERIGLSKVEVPHPEIMKWARNFIEGYRADERSKGEMYFNAETLPKVCVEAFELYCKVQGYEYTLTGGTTSELTGSANQIKKQTQAAEHALIEADPNFKSNATLAALEQKAGQQMDKLKLS